MERFEVEVQGGNLARAQLALNGAAIPTIASGADAGEPPKQKRGFFRSAGFWVLAIVILAFFTQRLIDPAEDQDPPSYSDFLTQVEEAPDSIQEVTLDPADTSIEVDERNGRAYETGYPPESEDVLINTLRRQGIETKVEQSGGGGILSLFSYLLPFLLFFAFWLFVMKRMERRQDERNEQATGLRLDSLRAMVEADSAEQATERVKGALPPDGGHSVRGAKPV